MRARRTRCAPARTAVTPSTFPNVALSESPSRPPVFSRAIAGCGRLCARARCSATPEAAEEEAEEEEAAAATARR